MRKCRSSGVIWTRKKIEWVDHSSDLDSLEKDMFFCRTWLWIGERKISVVNGFGTYGGIHPMYCNGLKNRGLLEIQIDGLNDVYGDLAADDVIRVIELIEKFGDDRIDKVFDKINMIGE